MLIKIINYKESVVMRYNINDRVVIVKNDRNNGKEGLIIDIAELMHCPVTIYTIAFEDNSKRYYFYSEIKHI